MYFFCFQVDYPRMGWEGGGGRGRGLLAGRLMSSSLWYITGGGDLGIFYWWGVQTLVEKGLLDFFCGKLLLPETTTCFLICERQSPIGYPKIIFFNIPGMQFIAKFKVRFIEIISHFKSDIRSCRCNNSSIKQASCLIGGLDPPDPPPWIRQCSQYVSIHYTSQHVTRRVSHFTASAIFGYIKRLS